MVEATLSARIAAKAPIAAHRQVTPPDSTEPRLRVFISYSRDDLDFAEQLHAALETCGFSCTIDRHGISGGENWRQRLATLIAEADSVAFVLSPSSAASEICAWEVAHAVGLGKRIIPVNCRPLGEISPPESLRSLNYIFFYPEPKVAGSGFGSGLAQLVAALGTDLGWMRLHTRYLQRALEWDVGGRPANRLLSGRDIEEARTWSISQPKAAAIVTELQLEFFRASEEEEKARSDARRRQVDDMARANSERQEALQKAEIALGEASAAQRRRIQLRNAALAGVSLLAILAGGLAKWAVDQKQLAVAQKELADQSSKAAEDRRKAAESLTNAATRLIVKHAESLDDEDQRIASAIFRRGVDLGLSGAMNNLGVQYARGRGGLPLDHAKARELYLKAASMGFAKAMENIAFQYKVGLGVERDMRQAREWFEKAANAGMPVAMEQLGIIYADGLGVPIDHAKAQAWFTKAAEKGHAPAMYNIGRMYEQGLGQPKDMGKAIEWYEKSAERGGTRAMSQLGVLYAQGRLVPQDYAKAKSWFEKSANAGSGEGMVQLGIIYERGFGVPRQTDRARELYLKAVHDLEIRGVDYLARLVAAEPFAAGRYEEALLRAREVSVEAERAEKSQGGRPGGLTSRALANESWYAVLANDGKLALSAAERALELNPQSLAALANKAHALLLLGRVDEARPIYARHKGRPGQIINGKTWDQLIAADLATMRKRGFNTAAIAQIELDLGIGGQQ